jgi:hypothetical protein
MADQTRSSKRSPHTTRQQPQAQPPTHSVAPTQSADAVQVQGALARPGAASPEAILALQRAIGNQAVQRWLASQAVQAKLAIGPADDAHEREADLVADQVTRTPAPTPPSIQRADEDDALQAKPLTSTITPLVQRETPEDEELQTKPLTPRSEDGFEAGADIEDRLNAQRGGGQPLAAETRASLEPRFGADFSGVRVHADGQAAQLSQAIQAKAFTRGQDIYFGAGHYQPASEGGKHLLAHELTHVVQQTGGAPLAHRQVSGAAPAAALQRAYDDIPSRDTWKADSKVKRTRRSGKLRAIDNELEVWERLKTSHDKHAQIAQLYDIQSAIRHWKDKKQLKYSEGGTSVRQTFIDDLQAAVDHKLTEIQGAYKEELAPLAVEYRQAAQAHNMDLTRTKGTQLSDAYGEFFYTTAQSAMAGAKTTDMLEWACYYFGAPQNAFGGSSLTSLSLKAITDFSWLTTALADKIIDDFLIPFQQQHANQIMQILQHRPFRQALEAKASADKYRLLGQKAPLLRITGAVEQGISTHVVDANNVDQLAEAVFNAFLADLPISNLIYSTVSSTFKTVDYLLGNADAKIGAPCMVLSNIFNELFKMVTPTPPAVIQGGDNRPLLTKPLASIGNRGILTRETAFKGNVKRYADVQGYDAINRIFFGDGHIWLVINGKEYDPTLGIHGGNGTVANAVEHFFVASGKDKYNLGKLVAKRTSDIPPGGPKLHFDRSVVIA